MPVTKIDKMLYSTMLQAEFVNNVNILNPALGLVDMRSAQEISQGGNFFTWRFREALSGTLTPIVRDTDLTSSAAVINQYSQKGVVLRRSAAWKEADVDIALTGADDAQQVLAAQLASYMAANYLNTISKAVLGAFKSAAFSDFVIDNISNGDLDYNMVIDAKADKFPTRNADYLKVLIVHPKIAAQMRKQGIKDFAAADNLVQNYLTTNTMPNINGIALVENSLMCESYTSGQDTVYPSYLVTPGAFLLDFQKEQTVESQRNILIGGGTNYYTAKSYYMATLKGATWAVSTENPTDVQLATGTNWDCVVPTVEEAKAIQILTKINV